MNDGANDKVKEKPPQLAKWLLRIFCDERWLSEIEGDLEEQFVDEVEKNGIGRARLLYWKGVLAFFRPHIWKKRKYNFRQNQGAMIRNYLKTTYRNLLRNKIYAAINIVGLSVGIACCLLISLYVFDELSFDKFFQNSDRIYRVALERKYPDHTRFFASSSVMVAPTLMENYPEVEKATRIHRLFFVNEVLVTVGEDTFAESKFLFADSAFFDVFSFQFIHGDPATALDDPTKIVVSDKIAIKYFNTTNVVDSTVVIGGSESVIAAVISDLPENSHLDFDILGQIGALGFLQNAIRQNNWTSPWLYTYITLRDGADPDQLQSKLNGMVQQFGASGIENQLGVSMAEYTQSGHEFLYFLQPLTDIHLHSNLDVEVKPNSDVIYVYLLSTIVVFILLISCINFINLSTARSTERAKEVGVRKVMGSFKANLVSQFLFESVFVSFVSLIIGIGLMWLMLPSFNALVAKTLAFSFLLNPAVILLLLAFTILVGLIAGGYPALAISTLDPAAVLKGEYKTSKRGTTLRNTLVVFQFFVSIVLISGALIIEKQLRFMQNKNLGFDKENVVVVNQAGRLGQNWRVFTEALRDLEPILDVGSAFSMPGTFFGSNIYKPDDPEKPLLRANTITIDDDFIATLQIEMIAGRSFQPEANDSLSMIINEAAAKVLGYDDPIGRRLSASNSQSNAPTPQVEIIGVVKDFNFQSLHSEVVPLVIFNGTSAFVPGAIALRVKPGDMEATISIITEKWDEIVPEQSMAYSFFEEDLAALYQAEMTSRKIFNAFTSLAILMACIGLFGLAAFVTQQRTKEIGIRKVMGASVPGIIVLVSREFAKLIGIAFLVAVPLSYFGMTKWLESFAFRVDIDVFVFLIAGGLTLAMALFTISYQSVKSALMNPVRSLRSE